MVLPKIKTQQAAMCAPEIGPSRFVLVLLYAARGRKDIVLGLSVMMRPDAFSASWREFL